MPLTVLPKSVFLHVPKTGGTWVSRALEAGVKDCKIYWKNPHVDLTGLSKIPNTNGKKIFTFIRHPLMWYKSFWRFRMATFWCESPIDSCKAERFEEFIENVLRTCSDYAGKQYMQFTDSNGLKPDYVGKTENLTNHLVEILKCIGENFDEQVIRNFPMIGVTNKNMWRAEYTPDHEKRMTASEQEAIDRFYVQTGNTL
jgi:hypothetical protein